MVKKNTSIHINGKRYDALTGNLLDNPTVPRKVRPKSVDGFTSPVKPASNPVKPLPASSVPRAKAAHAHAHQAKPSATLMRRAVAKPQTTSLKRRAKVQAPVVHPSSGTNISGVVVARKRSVHAVNHQRLTRAQQVSASPRVAHFAHELAVEVPKLAHEAVAAVEQVLAAPEPAVAFQPSVVVVERGSGTSDIFEQALLRATSHEQVAPVITTKRGRSLRRRMLSFAGAALAVLAIAGFLSFNSVGTRFKRETGGAGFSATLPSYTPKGFAVNSTRTAQGLVSVQYINPNKLPGSNTFAITQKATDWTDQTLLDRILSGNDNITYSALKTPKATVYMYGRNQAAWVSNGVLYQVLGNGLLGTQDFTQLATSL